MLLDPLIQSKSSLDQTEMIRELMSCWFFLRRICRDTKHFTFVVRSSAVKVPQNHHSTVIFQLVNDSSSATQTSHLVKLTYDKQEG